MKRLWMPVNNAMKKETTTQLAMPGLDSMCANALLWLIEGGQ